MSVETKTADLQLNQLREARAEVDRLKALIHAEMREKGAEGVLWSNGQCKAWRAYEAARAYLDEIREAIKT